MSKIPLEQRTIKMQHGFVGEDKADQDGEAAGRRRLTPQPEGMMQINRELLQPELCLSRACARRQESNDLAGGIRRLPLPLMITAH